MNSSFDSDLGKQAEPCVKFYGSTFELGGNILPASKGGVMMKRPGWVWLICIFMCFSFCWTMLSFYLIFSGSIPVSPAQMLYFKSLTPLDWVLTMLNTAITVIATAFLFLLKRQCVPLFGAGLVLGVLVTVWQVLTRGFLAALPEGGGVGYLLGMAISVSVLLYSRRLAHRGVLT